MKNLLATTCTFRPDLLEVQINLMRHLCKDAFDVLVGVPLKTRRRPNRSYVLRIKQTCKRLGVQAVDMDGDSTLQTYGDIFSLLATQYRDHRILFLHDDCFPILPFSFDDFGETLVARYFNGSPHTAIMFSQGDFPKRWEDFNGCAEISSVRIAWDIESQTVASPQVPASMAHHFWDYNVNWGMEYFPSVNFLHYCLGSARLDRTIHEGKNTIVDSILGEHKLSRVPWLEHHNGIDGVYNHNYVRCKHRSTATIRTEECKSCSRPEDKPIKLKVFPCTIHVECTPLTPIGLQVCNLCPDFVDRIMK